VRKGRYSFFELMLHTDSEKGIKFITNSLSLEMELELRNLLFDIFEEVMFLMSSDLFLEMNSGEMYQFELEKIDNKLIQCSFYKINNQRTRKELSSKIITLGQFINTGLKNVIDTVVGLRDLSNEMNRLFNEYVDQKSIKNFVYNPSY